MIRVTRALDDTQIKEFRAEVIPLTRPRVQDLARIYTPLTLHLHASRLVQVDIMACMRHVNIVQFVGACTKPPQLAIVTEYLPKMSLYDVMRTEALLWPRMLRIGSQVCVCACVRACVRACLRARGCVYVWG